jgi:L-lactate dehydrogenase complex protein LldG
MSAREDILARVRANLGRAAGPAPARPGAAPAGESQWWRHGGDLATPFRAKSEALATTVAEVAAWDRVPAAVARYLAAGGLPARAVGWPLLAAHPWREAGIEFEPRGAVDADLVGITGCFCAIAETGTLMLVSGPETPASVSLLPETHVAVVRESRIVADMEAAWALARTELGALPRAVNFVSGPSRTGDIERTIVLGAHGPYRVHVIVVRGV